MENLKPTVMKRLLGVLTKHQPAPDPIPAPPETPAPAAIVIFPPFGEDAIRRGIADALTLLKNAGQPATISLYHDDWSTLGEYGQVLLRHASKHLAEELDSLFRGTSALLEFKRADEGQKVTRRMDFVASAPRMLDDRA